MADNIITLTTDFGRKGFYVAQMKGVILSLNENAKIIDVTHEIQQQNIFEGAFILSQVWKYFPEKTVHIGVVDPGVGSSRRGLIIKTDYCYFIGPDNGLFSLALKDQNVEKIIEIDEGRVKKNSEIRDISKTFHGRDVFAPIAALISKGHEVDEFGTEIRKIKQIEIPKDRILYIDNFGNVITSIDKRNFEVGQEIVLGYKNKKISARFVETFSDGRKKEFLLLEGSHGFLELDMKEENAAKNLKAKVGDKIEVAV